MPSTGAVIEFGGSGGALYYNDTWELDSLGLSIVAAPAGPLVAPVAINFTPTLTTTSGADEIEWNFGAGASGPESLGSVTELFASAGTYHVSATVHDSFGVTVVADLPAIDIAFRPGFGFSGAGGCAPGRAVRGHGGQRHRPLHRSVVLRRRFERGGPHRLPTTYASPGTYLASATVTDAAGLTASAQVSVLVSAALTAPSISVSAPNGSTAPSRVVFTASPSKGAQPYNVSWSFGDGQTGAGTSPVYTYVRAGNYSVNCTVVDSTGRAAYRTPPSLSPPPPPVLRQEGISAGWPLVGVGVLSAVVALAAVAWLLRRRRAVGTPPTPSSPG